MQSDSLVIIPTYNEKENIRAIVKAVTELEKPFDVLVIDDGSPDGTADIVKEMMEGEKKGRLFLVQRKGKLGLGTAYICGFKWALEHNYEYIFEMDADFSHNPQDLPRLYAACHDEGYDVSVGSRYITGVNVVNWPIGRVLMSYYASQYVRTVLGIRIHDTTAGFVCYRRKVLQTIDLDAVRDIKENGRGISPHAVKKARNRLRRKHSECAKRNDNCSNYGYYGYKCCFNNEFLQCLFLI